MHKYCMCVPYTLGIGQMACPHSSEMYPFKSFGAKERLLTKLYNPVHTYKNQQLSVSVYLKEYRWISNDIRVISQLP